MFLLLLFIYVFIFVIALILYLTRKSRNFWRRVICNLRECPFGKESYEVINILNPIDTYEGIVSYSLYGKYEAYIDNLILNISKIKKYLPDWKVVIYLSVDIPENVVNELTESGAEVRVIGPDPPKGHEAALWRFLTAVDPKPFVSVDADDEFDEKMVGIIREWLNSDKQFLNFSPVSILIPINAGTWGSKNSAIPDIKERLEKYCEHWFGFDETFLSKEIWPIMKEKGYYRTRHFPFALLVYIGVIFLSFLIMLSLLKAREADKLTS